MPRRSALVLAACVCVASLVGCTGPTDPHRPLDAESPAVVEELSVDATSTAFVLGDRMMHAFDGFTGDPATMSSIQEQLALVDVVLIGELHDDRAAKLIQRRLTAAALPGPEAGGALSLEMLERGRAEDDSLRAWPDQGEGYRRTIRLVRRLGLPVVPANAPREAAAKARVEGLDALEDSRDYEVPTEDDRALLVGYRERFGEVMRELKGRANASAATTRPGFEIDDFFDAQLVWDVTMADSIRTARRQHGRPVVHLSGAFHTDFDGGLTVLLEERDNLRVMTVSLLPLDVQRLRPDDVGRADLVIYTGSERLPAPEITTRPARRLPTTLPATQPTTMPATMPTTMPATRPVTRSSQL
ncbi:MAG: ChaN family lipoprotein [Planctomycetota bacterium]